MGSRILLLTILSFSLVAAAAGDIPLEFISATLEPEGHKISVTAILILAAPADRVIEFGLNAKLDDVALHTLTLNGAEAGTTLQTGTTEGIIRWHFVRLPKSTPAGARVAVTLTYSGEIYDPVKKAGDLTFVVGDETKGLIGSEGIYLTGETGWYPVVKSPLALYDLRVKVPAPWEIVSQGNLKKRDATGSENSFYYSSDIPADSLTLVGGKYEVQSKDVDGVKVSTYFFPEEAALAPLYLSAVSGYLKKYLELLGPYPYKKFDVVENFFTSGYGFPSFTLLGNDVIKMGERALRPGYLDHEIVHCWYGNGLFFDPAKGNWVEGLTTYIANYLGNEAQGPEATRRYRLGMSQKYSLRVEPEKDYPLRRFEGKTEDFDNDIGYSKAAMVFHMLRRVEGDDAFFGVLKDFTQAKIGKVVLWEDFRAPMEEALGADLGWLFDDWLDRPGLPELAFQNVIVSSGAGGYTVQGNVVQKSERPYRLPLTIRVSTEAGARDFGLWLDSPATPFEFRTAEKPARVQLDPDYQILRRLSNEEMPPSLNAVLDSGSFLIVLPSHATDEMKAVYQKVADRAKSAKGGEIVEDSQVTDDEWRTQNLLALGGPKENRTSERLLANINEAILNDDPDRSILYSMRPTTRTFATIYHGNSAAALARASYIFYYGWDSYVVFEKGVPATRGYFESPMSPARMPLLATGTGGAELEDRAPAESPNLKTAFGLGISMEQLRADVAELTDPDFRGRFAADPTHFEASKYISSRFESLAAKAGLEGRSRPDWDSAWLIALAELIGEPRVSFIAGGQMKSIPIVPFIFDPVVENATAWEVGTTGTTNYGGHLGTIHYVGDGLSDSDYAGFEELDTVVLEDGPATAADATAVQTLFDKLRQAHEHNAIAAVVLRDRDRPSFSPYYIAYPNKLPEGEEAMIQKLKSEGRFFGIDQYLTSIQSRLPRPPIPLDISAVTATREDFLAAVPEYAMWRQGPQTDRSITDESSEGNLSLRLSIREIPASNLRWMLLPVASGQIPRKPGIIIGAHYDHLGFNNRGELMPGAVDNASGVAALLAIAEYFAKHPEERKLPMWFVAFDAEEWGLLGSLEFVRNLSQDAFRLMINLDSLAGGKEDSMYLIGRTHQPDLVPLVEKALNEYGLKLAPDIDPYAFEFGSDFYPFHKKGIPAVGFFDAQYREIHKPTDTIDKVNFDRLAREVAALISLIKQIMNP
ncbi:MAG: M20/M25/M40 family metallo-hydrolase [bacterium]